jgi:hypothetical protein
MPIGAQPPGRRGTVGHPFSALKLRLVLAAFGLVTSLGLGVLVLRAGFGLGAWLLFGLAAVAAVDIVVITLRLRARRRAGRKNS